MTMILYECFYLLVYSILNRPMLACIYSIVLMHNIVVNSATLTIAMLLFGNCETDKSVIGICMVLVLSFVFFTASIKETTTAI